MQEDISVKDIETLKNINPITDISFSLSESMEKCCIELNSNSYEVIDGNIRESCGGKYGAIGVKKFGKCEKYPITNIIGTLTEERQYFDNFKLNGIDYNLITYFNDNGDIHLNEGGVYCYLYYTRDKKFSPIKDIIFKSYDYENEKTDKQEVAQNSIFSLVGGDLDLAGMRGFKKKISFKKNKI